MFDYRRSLLRALALTPLATASVPRAVAQPAGADANWPTRPIRLVMPYAPGGLTDTSARLIAEPLGALLGQPVVVDNRPGAGSTVASQFVARQPADGYTLYCAPTSLIVNPVLQGNVGYDPHKDFVPISMMIDSAFILHAHPDLAAKNLKELIDLVRKAPNRYSIGTSGMGAINHLAAEHFLRSFDLKMNVVHYKGGVPAAQDLIGGNIHMMFSAAIEALPFVREGRTRAMAVSSRKRLALLPDLPTVEEAAGIPEFDALFWMAMVAPAATPKSIIDKLSAAMAQVGRDEALRKALADRGVDLNTADAAQTRAIFDRDEKKWSKLISELGLKQ